MKDFKPLTLEDGKILVSSARKAVTEFLKNKKKLKFDDAFRSRYSFRSGVFVTLNNNSGLRGCIGYPLPQRSLSAALEDAAIAAAVEDPRFSPVKSEELTEIIFEVTILTPPERIIISNPDDYLREIKVGRDGLIVRNRFFSGLLLPQVPVEYGWSEKEFLENTCIKAGLTKDCWKEKDTEILKFAGIIFKEKNPNGEIVREEL